MMVYSNATVADVIEEMMRRLGLVGIHSDEGEEERQIQNLRALFGLFCSYDGSTLETIPAPSQHTHMHAQGQTGQIVNHTGTGNGSDMGM